MDLITLIVVGGVTYYLITSGTLDQIVQNLGIGGGGNAPSGGGGGQTAGAAPARNYKTSSTSHSGYTTGGGSYGGGSPGWYTEGPNGSGHHHCVAHTAGCFCTDPPKCVSQGVPPTSAGECKPQFGTKSYLGGGPYPTTADFSKCPAGTT